ncbi:hypothetical protein ACOMHN_018409 [Nucella lapillus]
MASTYKPIPVTVLTISEMMAAKVGVAMLCLATKYPNTCFHFRLLDEVSGRVEDIKALCLQIKMAALHHPITICGKQVTASLWSRDRLRKVSVTTELPVHGYPHNPLTWTTQVVMGDMG